MEKLLTIIFSTDFFYSILRVTTPILFASMGAVVANLSGTPNIALEGIMLIAAFVGMYVSYLSASAWIGLVAAIGAGMLAAGILAFFTLYYRTNVILGGIAINSLASGGTIFFLYLIAGDKGTSVSLNSKVLPQINIPLIQDIPILGDIVSGHNFLTYLSIISVFTVYYMIKRTPLGLRMRAVGEQQAAAESVGINVIKIKVIALLISGALAGLGGAFMSMGYVSWFSRDMVSGRGWIAIAAEAMGRTTAIGTAVTSVLFGVADAFSNTVSVLGWPADLVGTIPYCVTLIGLFIFSLREYRKRQ